MTHWSKFVISTYETRNFLERRRGKHLTSKSICEDFHKSGHDIFTFVKPSEQMSLITCEEFHITQTSEQFPLSIFLNKCLYLSRGWLAHGYSQATNGHFILSCKKQRLLFRQTLKHKKNLTMVCAMWISGVNIAINVRFRYCYNYGVLDKVRVKISTWSTQELAIDTMHTHAHGKFIRPYIGFNHLLLQWI